MSELLATLTKLSTHSILKNMALSQILDFLSTASLLKRDIMLAQPAKHSTDTGDAPKVLPPLVQAFLTESVGIDVQTIPDAWDILKDLAWTMIPLAERIDKEKEAFREFGWARGFSESSVFPYTTLSDTNTFGSINYVVSTSRLLHARRM